MCNIRRFYWLRELYEADFPKPGIYGSGRVWLRRGRYCVAHRLELVTVAGLLWISWCVLGGRDFSVIFFLRTHTAYCTYEAASCLIYLSTSNEARPREQSDRGRFCLQEKKPLHAGTGVRTGCHYFISLSIRLCVYV